MRAAGAALLLLIALPAAAWESECAVEPVRQRRLTDYEANICATDQLPQCAEGHEAARGAQLGEHSMITQLAMSLGGVPSYVADDQTVLSYFADRAGAPTTGGPAQTVEPACPGAMRVEINGPGGERRAMSVPEFAHVPDYSYSLSDYIMGNEHCPSTSKLEYSAAAMNACHTFRTHTSVVNSNHFVPQSRSMYRRYHQLALSVAERCAAMAAARNAADHQYPGRPHRARFQRAVEACELEALALQAFASHFLEDAWSTGHMWQRWGTPAFPTPREYSVQHLVGVYSGTLHGLRGPIYAATARIGALALFHDQLCLPGPQPVVNGLALITSVREAAPVVWTYPRMRVPTGTDLTQRWGAGDLYFLPCTASLPLAQLPYVNLPLDSTRELGFHNRRMMTCVAHGFREVYAATSRTHGDLSPLAALLDPDIKPAPQPGGVAAGSLSQLCWEQRVTNQSMWEGTRLGDQERSLFQPGIAAGTLALVLPRLLTNIAPDPTAAQAVVEAHRPGATDLVRAAAMTMGAWIAVRGAEAPDETDVANLEGEILADFAGMKRNADYVGLYDLDPRDGGISYLERPFTAQWQERPSNTPCSRDSDCQFDDMHSYCDRWAAFDADAGRPLARCSALETPILRAFREGETPFWCSDDSWSALEAARAACKGKSATSPECRACVQVVGPKLRNACDPGMEGGNVPTNEVPQPRSVCDVMVAERVMPSNGPGVNWPYERDGGETWEQAADRAVLEACQAGPQGTPNPTASLQYSYDLAPQPTGDVVNGASGTFTQNAGICGRSPTPTHWEHWRTLGDITRAWTLELRATSTPYFGAAQPISRLKLELFRGPRCDPMLDLRTSGTPVDTDGDGAADTLRLVWTTTMGTPDDVCVRVSAKDALTRTGYRLQRL